VKVARRRKRHPNKDAATGRAVTARDQKRLLDLFGRLTWDSTFDYKAERSRRMR
jgi:hypothetical protein